MKRSSLLILLICLYLDAYTQYLHGFVFDRETHNPVASAIVYLSGTFNGTYTDQSGAFRIKVPEDTSIPLVISSIGYYSVTVSGYTPEKEMIIELNQKVYMLNEVVVQGNSRKARAERRRNLQMFRNEFLGTTVNGTRCSITNEDDIIFTWDPENLILQAYCYKPITIDNKGLGYVVSYYLDNFIFNTRDKSLVFTGNILFREDKNINKIKASSYQNRRKSVFLGSRMHFFRELWADNIDSSGFLVKSRSNKVLLYDNLVGTGDGMKKFLRSDEDPLWITYYSLLGGTLFHFEKDSVAFDRDGWYDALGISITGEMSRLRVGDWLPYEYSLPVKKGIKKSK